MKRFFIFALVATMFAACSTDTTQDIISQTPTLPETLYASFDEEDTRVQLKNDQTIWNAGDLVSVFYRSNANDKWAFQGATGDRNGTLKCVETTTPTTNTARVVAVYPYNKDYKLDTETNQVQAFLPAEQTFLKDSYGIGSSIMVSSSLNDNVSLKNVCGWLKLQLLAPSTSALVEKVTLRGNNGEQVAGELYINVEDATCTLASSMGGGVTNENILTEVSINYPTGIGLNENATTAFYFALPPQTFQNGMTVEVHCTDGSVMTKRTAGSLIIERNHIVPLSPIEYTATNAIYYTSSDGNIVTPNKTDVFGANIVSNTYENGVGVIIFDSNVTSIGKLAFNNCASLTSITIPNSVTSIGNYAFSKCKELRAFYGKFTSADNRCLIVNGALRSFAPAELTTYTIPDSVTSIGATTFCNCSVLKDVIIPDGVTSIGMEAFSYCSALKNITMPDSVTLIDNWAFSYCSALASVTIGNNTTLIGASAFIYCGSLTSITIPDSVTKISSSAFNNCKKLKEVYCKPTTPPSLGNTVFSNNAADRKIYVPTVAVDAYKAASNWSDYAADIEEYTFTD